MVSKRSSTDDIFEIENAYWKKGKTMRDTRNLDSLEQTGDVAEKEQTLNSASIHRKFVDNSIPAKSNTSFQIHGLSPSRKANFTSTG